jgi:hypothetical protein
MVKRFDMHRVKKTTVRVRYLFPAVLLLVQMFLAFVDIPSALASPTFTTHSISPTYTHPGPMTVAGGALWYLQRSASASEFDSMGKMTTTGTTVDYPIGYPPGKTNFTTTNIITGPDGNVWFIGSGNLNVYLGKLDIATGNITFYLVGPSSFARSIAAGSDGKIYFSYKVFGAGPNSYVKSLDLATNTIDTIQTFDTYANLGDMFIGPDSRLYVYDNYYKWLYVYAVSGGTGSVISATRPASNMVSGPDGNIWFMRESKLVKMTTAGVRTAYDLPDGVNIDTLVAGADGALWFRGGATTYDIKIGRVTTSGVVTEYASIPGTGPYYHESKIVLGPDDGIWFNYRDGSGQYLGRFGY